MVVTCVNTITIISRKHTRLLASNICSDYSLALPKDNNDRKVINNMKDLPIAVLILLLVLAPSLSISYAATISGRACYDNRSCVVSFANGTQFVELSNKKWACINNVIKGLVESTSNNPTLSDLGGQIAMAICLKSA